MFLLPHRLRMPICTEKPTFVLSFIFMTLCDILWPPAPLKSCYLARNLKEVARAWSLVHVTLSDKEEVGLSGASLFPWLCARTVGPNTIKHRYLLDLGSVSVVIRLRSCDTAAFNTTCNTTYYPPSNPDYPGVDVAHNLF